MSADAGSVPLLKSGDLVAYWFQFQLKFVGNQFMSANDIVKAQLYVDEWFSQIRSQVLFSSFIEQSLRTFWSVL